MGYKGGELIAKCQPLVYVLDGSNKHKLCDNCFVENNKLKTCSVCKSMFYCNAICQKRDWKQGHKFECRTFASFYKNNSRSPLADYTNRITMRLYNMVTFTTVFANKKFPLYNNKEICYSDLKDYVDRMSQTRMNMFKKVRDDLKKVNFKFCEKVLLSVYGKITVHLFTIYTERLVRIGVGMYLEPSVFEHSCIPNIAQTFNGLTMEFRASKDFDENEKPVFCFINPMYSLLKRKMILDEQFHVNCECRRCATDDITENDHRYYDFEQINQAFLLAVCKKEIKTAIEHGKRVLNILDKAYPYPQAEVSIHLSRMICAYFDLPKEERNIPYSLNLLRRAYDSFRVTHGDESAMTKEMANLVLLYEHGYC